MSGKPVTQPRSVRIRAMLAEGRPIKEIAATLGCTRQTVYQQRYSDKQVELAKAKRKPGRPKGSKNQTEKRPSFTLSTPAPAPATTNAHNAHNAHNAYNAYTLTVAPISVPKPERFTFTQRLRILFTGKAA